MPFMPVSGLIIGNPGATRPDTVCDGFTITYGSGTGITIVAGTLDSRVPEQTARLDLP
jgi:hypothetical protein